MAGVDAGGFSACGFEMVKSLECAAFDRIYKIYRIRLFEICLIFIADNPVNLVNRVKVLRFGGHDALQMVTTSEIFHRRRWPTGHHACDSRLLPSSLVGPLR